MRKLSVIVRFRNEAVHLGAVLRAIRAQRCSVPVEIVAVDNASTDGSRDIAAQFADKLVQITDYRPGAALNRSIERCSGDHVVVVSAHAIPSDERWLENLIRPLRNPDVLGVYGGQIYPISAKFLDKRDLDIFSDIRPRSETRDSDFWNANSAFGVSSWEKQPFDETVIELEDHHWTKQILPEGNRWIRFEPEARVYHYGHETRNDRQFLTPDGPPAQTRIREAVRVLEGDSVSWPAAMSAGMTLGSLWREPATRAAVPLLGRYLLEYWDFDVRWRMAGALGRLDYPESVPYLVRGLADPSFYARDECAWSLARLGATAVPEVLKAVQQPGRMAHGSLPFASLALGMSGTQEGRTAGLDLLERCLSDGDPQVERDAVYFLGELGSAQGRTALLKAVVGRLGHEDYETARAALWCWGMLAERAENEGDSADRDDLVASADAVVLAARQHPQDVVRAEAVAALGRLARAAHGGPTLAEVARSLRNDGCGRVRYAAIQSLRLIAESGNPSAAMEAVAHSTDVDDFGVLFERELILATAQN
ncbi:HEAT repeat domain-containing protein [Streptomyces sp. NBC_01275]|uniref:HEAT repeat domain-containing protein n=1 Tax=Streptomyces sp. NBC_01275 TaxID=2903807 RepID=UPI00225453D9|nr:HEAT repeat domain-containing protein [Streptomyces sp. NBC_01275]MCX4763822.1 HEAT repeat domain-containing protein [Streptomyces sp. NBC_01275]